LAKLEDLERGAAVRGVIADCLVTVLRPGAVVKAVPAVGFPKDIVPWRRTDFELRAKWVKASLPATVIREGRLLYEAA
jgi:hypothetical protein